MNKYRFLSDPGKPESRSNAVCNWVNLPVMMSSKDSIARVSIFFFHQTQNLHEANNLKSTIATNETLDSYIYLLILGGKMS